MLNTYLGQKGYTLLKKELTEYQISHLKEELTVKPLVQGGFTNPALANTYPVYRESTNKIYIPRYYGENTFGLAATVKIPRGYDICITFAGQLRENQVPVVEKFMNHLSDKKDNSGGGLLELPCAYGKTTLALYICAQIQKKALIIVHKEFLMNQWIERIQQFLPGARVGKIQGQIIDMDDKDIVIGMLQSLSMKEYPASTFDSFGLTIIDEVHHISSEVFSRALFRIVTRYTLGLSATMNRKDGTTNVFKMFLGEVIYKGQRKDEHTVTVRSIHYVTTDEDFNKVILDFRGNTQYSSMISKLCEYNRRTEFILRVIIDMLEENGEQQIIVLAHNRSLLKYFHDAIQSRNIASVGYYVGGMKEVALKESECKKIILATYSMAAEALDIKTLTTLIMATPKTDIEQSVGRVLRVPGSSPTVVDIVDQHHCFKNQWAKRKAFYKKQNYKIIQISSPEYNSDISVWSVKFQSSNKQHDKIEGGDDNNINNNDAGIGKCLISRKNKPTQL